MDKQKLRMDVVNIKRKAERLFQDASELLDYVVENQNEEPTPDPEANYTIEHHPNAKGLDGRWFPAGTKINFAVTVKEDGQIPQSPVNVVWSTGQVKQTDEYGNSGLPQVTIPQGGLTLTAHVEGFPDVSTSFTIRSSGVATPDPQPQPEPTPEPTPNGEPPVTSPIQGSPVQILLFAVGANVLYPKPVDVRINGTWYRLSGKEKNDPFWNVEFQGARGRIMTLSQPLYDLYFEGIYNNFTVKLQKKHPSTDFNNLRVDVPKGHIQHWSSSYGGFGGMWDANNKNVNQPHEAGLNFPHFTSNDVLSKGWSDSGKLVVRFGA